MKNRFVAALTAAIVATFAASGTLAGGLLSISFLDSMPHSTELNNPYWPLMPHAANSGMTRTWTYHGEGEDGCAVNTITAVEGDTKSDFGGDYLGSIAQVVKDQEWEVDECDDVPEDEDLTELTYDWYLQDDFGNIWYMGEASRSFEDGCPSLEDLPDGNDWETGGNADYSDLEEDCTEGSWQAGAGEEPGDPDSFNAVAGVVVPSDMPLGALEDPLAPGTFYMQEVAEGAEDMAKVLKLEAAFAIDYEESDFDGGYSGCRKVKEWTALEPGGSVEHKFYCHGEGLLLINGVGGGPTEREILEEMIDVAP